MSTVSVPQGAPPAKPDAPTRKTGRGFKGAIYCRRWTSEGKKRKAWGIRWSVNGGPVKRKIVADTREAAQAVLDKKREDYQQRRLDMVEGRTLRDLAEPYLDYQRTKERHIPTVEARLKRLLAFFGDTPLEEIEDLTDQYKLTRRATYKMAPCKSHAASVRCPRCDKMIAKGTVNYEIKTLNHILHLARIKFKMLRYQPVIERLGGEPEGRERPLTPAEETQLLPVCGPDLHDLIEAGLNTGMREGEILKLTRAQIDLEQRLVRFPPTKKGRKRDLPINERLYYVLARRCTSLAPTDLVFTRKGKRWTRSTISAQMRQAARAAGIPPLWFHDLRHTVASRLDREGADRDDTQRVLGHRSGQTTERYIHVETEQLRPILALLDRYQASTREAHEATPGEDGNANVLN